MGQAEVRTSITAVIHVAFHRLAAAEQRRARRHYENERSGLGRRFVEAIDRAVHGIEHGPESFPLFQGKFRWSRVRRFSYILYFQILSANQVLVLAVAHSRRRPGYW